MQFTMEAVLIKSILQFKGGSVSSEALATLLKRFRTESNEKKREVATAAAIALRIPLSRWTWSPVFPSEKWDLGEMVQLRRAHGDGIAETYLEILRDDPTPKNRAIAGLILLDIAWNAIPIVSPSMSHRILVEMRSFLAREQNSNVLGFVRMHMGALAKAADLGSLPTPKPHLEPSRN